MPALKSRGQYFSLAACRRCKVFRPLLPAVKFHECADTPPSEPLGGTWGSKDISVSCFLQPGGPSIPNCYVSRRCFHSFRIYFMANGSVKNRHFFLCCWPDYFAGLSLGKKKKKRWGRGWDEYLFDLRYLHFWIIGNWGSLPSALFRLMRFRDEMSQHLKYFNCFCYETSQGGMTPCSICELICKWWICSPQNRTVVAPNFPQVGAQ